MERGFLSMPKTKNGVCDFPAEAAPCFALPIAGQGGNCYNFAYPLPPVAPLDSDDCEAARTGHSLNNNIGHQ
jgi:hypothetical protein